MGIKCCKISVFGRKPAINVKKVNLIFLGLDNAGKTTIIRRLVKESIEGITKTIGFAPYHFSRKGCNVTIFDIGGGSSIRDIWRKYYADVHGIVFVVDAFDRDRIAECRNILRTCLTHPKIQGKPILLLANKQDKPDALDELDIVQKLELESLVNQQKCPTLVELCAAVVAKKDTGIENGIDWILWKITKDYPTLNNRVLVDTTNDDDDDINPETFVVQNGNVPSHWPQNSQNNFEFKKSHSELFFSSHDWSSTTELLDAVPVRKMLEMQRPKSAGVAEFKIKKRTKKKRRLRNNKTMPLQVLADATYTVHHPIPTIFDQPYSTDVTYMNGNASSEIILNVSNLTP